MPESTNSKLNLNGEIMEKDKEFKEKNGWSEALKTLRVG